MITRLGIALAQPALIQVLSNTKAPYNISTPTASLALAALSPSSIASMHSGVSKLLSQRTQLLASLTSPPLSSLGLGEVIGATDANFVMIPVLKKDGSGAPDNARAQAVYKALAEEEGVVVRFRGNEPGCTACLRITVGSAEENATVLAKFKKVLTRL